MMNDQSCSTNNGGCKKMGVKCVVPVSAVFVTLFVFQWIFHGVYMMPQYEATASMWRTQEEMQSLMWVCLVTKLITAFAVTCLYCWLAQACPSGGKCYKKGAKFGLKIGLILGAHDFASYAWLPIQMDMAVNWFIGDVIMGVLVGLALALSCRITKKAA